jgi:hypothetical protein
MHATIFPGFSITGSRLLQGDVPRPGLELLKNSDGALRLQAAKWSWW